MPEKPENRARQQGDDGKIVNDGGIVSAVEAALEQFNSLTQYEPVAVTGVRRKEESWSVLVDVVELERIPSTTSVMATYRVDVDKSGQLIGYERLRRFVRSSVDPT